MEVGIHACEVVYKATGYGEDAHIRETNRIKDLMIFLGFKVLIEPPESQGDDYTQRIFAYHNIDRPTSHRTRLMEQLIDLFREYENRYTAQSSPR